MPRVDGQADFYLRAPTRRSPAGASRGAHGGLGVDPAVFAVDLRSRRVLWDACGYPAARLDGGIAHHACGVEPRLHICMRTPHVCMRMLAYTYVRNGITLPIFILHALRIFPCAEKLRR